MPTPLSSHTEGALPTVTRRLAAETATAHPESTQPHKCTCVLHGLEEKPQHPDAVSSLCYSARNKNNAHTWLITDLRTLLSDKTDHKVPQMVGFHKKCPRLRNPEI